VWITPRITSGRGNPAHLALSDAYADKTKLSPACGRRGPFHGGKGPKTPCAGRAPFRLLRSSGRCAAYAFAALGRHRASPVPCASRRMRAGTNSGILAFGRCATPLAALATPSLRRCAACSVKQWCLAPAFDCDARRALRRVVALGPRIHALQLGFPVSSHRIMATSDPRLTALDPTYEIALT